MEKKTAMLCTSILIGLFNKDSVVVEKSFAYCKDYEFKISPLVYYEFLRGAYNNSDLIPKKPLDMERIMFKLGIKEITKFDRATAQSCAYLWAMMRKNNKSSCDEENDIDILIGATASFMQCPIWTLNKKHFLNIPELEFLDEEEDIK